MKLSNKVAVVVGGSQGIGEAIVRRLAKEGATVAIVSRTSERAAVIVKEIRDAGGQADQFNADISRVSDTQEVVGEVLKRFGTVDILVNCAGLFKTLPLAETTEKIWDDQLDINLKGAFFMMQAVMPEMRRKRYGKIVNIASIAGVGAFENSTAYCASKGGLIALTRAVAFEVAKEGINVNSIGPGAVLTPMNAHLRDVPGWSDSLRSLTPNGEDLLGTDDIAGGVVYFASDDSRACHGALLMIDGGWSIW